MPDTMQSTPERVTLPQLDRTLSVRVEIGRYAVSRVSEALANIRHDESDAQIHALALYGTITQLFSACILLTEWGEPTAIPILLRSMYEALVDLHNLLHGASYVEHIQAANLKQTLSIMKSGPLREFQDARKADFEQFVTQLAELHAKGKGPLRIRSRCERAGRLDQYESLYGLFCLDTHNNASALAERHISKLPDGKVLISLFGEYDVQSVARRLDWGLQILLEAGQMIHGAFRVPAPSLDEVAAMLDRERTALQARSPAAAEEAGRAVVRGWSVGLNSP